jgi:hypothetical protein
MSIDPRFLVLDLSPAAFAYYKGGRTALAEVLPTLYDEDIAAYVDAEILTIWEDHEAYECSDSFRFADVSNPADRLAFELSHSCCGQADFEFRPPSGATFLYGFNYGHCGVRRDYANRIHGHERRA